MRRACRKGSLGIQSDEKCLFCSIAAGESQASIAYEDHVVVAFMDLAQFETNPGHTLVVPRRHIADVFDLDDGSGAALMSATKKVALGLRNAFGAEGVNVTIANGEAAGQEVFHLHIHVYPRRKGDGLWLRYYENQPHVAERNELDRQAALLRKAIEEVPL
jgi:histidine triad (HIT) family protein